MKNENQSRHLVFYDGQCGLCDQVVLFLLKVDHKECFVFAPLQGKTAAFYLEKRFPYSKKEDSLILIENYDSSAPHLFVLAKGALRIAWLLGGPWCLLGWLSFFPSILFNWAYRLVARYRYRLFPKTTCVSPSFHLKDRFLP